MNVNGNNGSVSYKVIYFDRIGVEDIPKEIKKFIENKSVCYIYRIEAYDSIMRGYFRTRFIDFMLKRISLLDYTNSFSPNKSENKIQY